MPPILAEVTIYPARFTATSIHIRVLGFCQDIANIPENSSAGLQILTIVKFTTIYF
jgi:hypothetical protein